MLTEKYQLTHDMHEISTQNTRLHRLRYLKQLLTKVDLHASRIELNINASTGYNIGSVSAHLSTSWL